MVRHLHSVLIICIYIFVFLFFLWAVAALYIDASGWLSLFLVLVCVASSFYFKPFKQFFLFISFCCVLVLIWWFTLSPSNDRDWRVDVARLPSATIENDNLSVSNVRNFQYQSENRFTEKWETRKYNLDKLVGIDMSLIFWGPKNVAHTITSWRFSDGTHLAVSIETRKEKHEDYSAFKGFFRQFEIYYVVADEEDLIKLRTNHRGEKVYLYNLKMPMKNARALLLDYLREINKLKEEPRWYNALTHNCTTAIRFHNKQIGAAGPLDWRLILNGNLDELGYERGVIDTSLSLDKLREVSNITKKAKELPSDANFSAAIRRGLPGFTD